MKFDLTRNQIRILLQHDQTFMEQLLDNIVGVNPVEGKAWELARSCGNNKIGAIKELREWSKQPENRSAVESSGHEYSDGQYGFSLGLLAAKLLIEKYQK